MMHVKKTGIILTIVVLLVLSGCSNKEDIKNTLMSNLSNYAMYYASHGEDSGSHFFNYSSINYEQADFPDHYDLREKGIVTSVKDQGEYGTCWAFASLAASETNILNELGLTVQEYKEKYGKEIDFSETYHAHFTFNPIQNDDGLDGIVVGEPIDEYDYYYIGGNDLNSMSSLSNLFGPNNESDYPYNNDPVFQNEERYKNEFMLQNLDFLVNPHGTNDDGAYKYVEEGTDSIKKALLDGNAVVISYFASVEETSLTYEEAYSLVDDVDCDEKTKELYAKLRSNTADWNSITKDKALELVEFRLDINGLEKDLYDLKDRDKDFILSVLVSPYFGYEQDEVFGYVESGQGQPAMNGETSAQYTFYPADSNHEVLIVGYDDNYSKDNFIEKHKPPHDGAWIIKNSWGNDTYDNGYFYLSYYDQSIESPVVYNYYLNDEEPSGDIDVYSYDLMCVGGLSSSSFDSKLSLSNVYSINNNGTIFSIGLNTANYNTDVSIEVYKLDSIGDKPDKGKKLYSTVETYTYAGYHTHSINNSIDVNQGDIIAVVTTQKANNKYILVNGYSLSKNGYEAIKSGEIEFVRGTYPTRYACSIINQNESYIKYGNTWYDYRDEIDDVVSNSKECGYLTYDNPSIKLFVEVN